MILEKQAVAFAPACALIMDEVFHGGVCALQLAQPPHGQHRTHRAYQKRQHKENGAVSGGVSQNSSMRFFQNGSRICGVPVTIGGSIYIPWDSP